MDVNGNLDLLTRQLAIGVSCSPLLALSLDVVLRTSSQGQAPWLDQDLGRAKKELYELVDAKSWPSTMRQVAL